MSDILEILARDDGGLASLLKSVLLDSEGKVPADRLRIVGALASGAVMESGSNANGSYIKYADGTMICFSDKHLALESTSGEKISAGAMFFGNITYPVQFFDVPIVIVNTEANSNSHGFTGGAFTKSKSGARIVYYSIVSILNEQWSICCYITVGRWKA